MNKYQKAIEEIKKIVAFAEARNPKGNYPFSEEEEIFKKIYEITNGDYSEKTEWLRMNYVIPGYEYWFIDINNKFFKGTLREAKQYDFKPVMFAEIKPPAING